MTTEDQRHLLDLQFLQELLKKRGIATNLYEKSAETPMSFLAVSLPAANEGTDVLIQLMYIPTSEALAETNLLQFFVENPEQIAMDNLDLRPLLAYLNLRTPLGYFGLTEQNVFYRYVYSLGRFEVPNEANFVEILDLFTQTFSSFTPLVLRVLKGELSLEEAKAQLG